MRILGISCYYHDSVTVSDGQLVAAAMEERFTHLKHDSRFPLAAIRFCLDAGGVKAQNTDYLVVYERPISKLERILQSSLAGFPRTMSLFRKSMASWFGEKLWIKGHIASELGIAPDRILFVEHHLADTASAFFSSPFRESTIVTVDGVGEWTTTAVGEAIGCWDRTDVGNSVRLIKEIRYPDLLVLLYSTLIAYL